MRTEQHLGDSVGFEMHYCVMDTFIGAHILCVLWVCLNLLANFQWQPSRVLINSLIVCLSPCRLTSCTSLGFVYSATTWRCMHFSIENLQDLQRDLFVQVAKWTAWNCTFLLQLFVSVCDVFNGRHSEITATRRFNLCSSSILCVIDKIQWLLTNDNRITYCSCMLPWPASYELPSHEYVFLFLNWWHLIVRIVCAHRKLPIYFTMFGRC